MILSALGKIATGMGWIFSIRLDMSIPYSEALISLAFLLFQPKVHIFEAKLGENDRL